MTNLQPVLKVSPDREIVQFRCPGCGRVHRLNVSPDSRPCWSWNGDDIKPTFSPSIKATSGHNGDGNKAECWCTFEERYGKPPYFRCGICHSFVKDGQIQFLSDCTHELAGKTVPLQPWEDAA